MLGGLPSGNGDLSDSYENSFSSFRTVARSISNSFMRPCSTSASPESVAVLSSGSSCSLDIFHNGEAVLNPERYCDPAAEPLYGKNNAEERDGFIHHFGVLKELSQRSELAFSLYSTVPLLIFPS
jgi:hypothetical protein